ncbi:5-carboxymethyl-2-hydroxymuconate isomerase [Pigmentiphaga sp.]|uniref:5-carboxymethyl-2-hydroxymuconate isomerase n=1 Tax=Pigmentiphaga sp. TaxID=1977564 RepID=UPI00128C9C85|nr:5-carboxymethyl-2-hydroxymuconate isomerase [Pigmentiphaga sp.]MPS28311.1 5-carboxymethyl-2-hydroxymuconate Delta-isomerase [Alcaligenaceae bacterium SAGV5]MPS50524.1 5-carboxymethyl-2-hydroxymuconate Delta-isomerase [Alcaligenaceae bacterium SAGV3]MPT58353.1 5-carboxymethyl-2-hydroxymuconate Delta-isomerase [Alcaligenaceae bacterium]
MPHLWMEYSDNLESHVEVDALLGDVHREVVADGVFPLAGLRTRAVPVRRYRIADGHPDNVFVHFVLRTLPGRDPAVKKASTDRLFAAILARFKPLSDRLPIAISMHVEEASPDLGYRLSTYRQHMAARTAGGGAGTPPA